MVTLYDDKARPVYSHSKNEYLQTEDISNIKLEDFLGLTLETHNKHIAYGDTTLIVDKFTYNEHNQSLVKHTQNINSQGEELIVFNEYDELGQLIEKRVGGGDVANASNTLQNINFNYNIRGWLTDINDVLNPNPDKLFAFNIRYNDLPDGSNTQALFNGNISETHWRTQNTSSGIRSYSYEYDALNRLNSANYLTPHAMIGDLDGEQEDFFEGDINYDKNGNILSLKRKGATTSNTIDLIDDLDYDYFSMSNQLSRVSDTADDNGFKDGNTSGNDYTYDANGNMIEDKNKDIINIEYNHLNLPKKVEFATQSMTGKYIEYVYDATGVKLAKRVQQDGLALINFTYYSGAFIYSASNSSPDVNLKFISQPEGYIEPIDASDLQQGFDYVYQFKDHLGNIRLSYKDSDGNGSIDANTEIVEENNYYPFGLEHKGYNYVVNGSENKYQTYLHEIVNTLRPIS